MQCNNIQFYETTVYRQQWYILKREGGKRIWKLLSLSIPVFNKNWVREIGIVSRYTAMLLSWSVTVVSRGAHEYSPLLWFNL